MKKTISIAIACVLAIACVFAMTTAVFAADVTAPGTSNTTMTYTVASTYTVVIPEAVTIGVGKTGTITIGVNAGALIAHDTAINVKLTTCDFELTNDDDNLTYTIKDGETLIAVDGIVHTHAAGELEASSNELTVTVVDDAKYSGDYTDSVTFTVSVDEVVAPVEP